MKMFKKHLLGLAVCLAALSWMRVSKDTSVEAILMQKARICFNSMSTSFQSECVYCDSKLYASTITACTGQPNLANNVTQAQAFCIATACLQQTGKNPMILGRRRKRSLSFMPLGLAFNKNRLKPNATVTAQLNKSVNGTTSGNLAFYVNNPKLAYKWQNSLTRVLISKKPSKTVQWQFGKGPAAIGQAASGSASTTAAPAAGGGEGGSGGAGGAGGSGAGGSGGGASATPAPTTQSRPTNSEGEATASLSGRPPARPVRGPSVSPLLQASPLLAGANNPLNGGVSLIDSSSVEFAPTDFLASATRGASRGRFPA